MAHGQPDFQPISMPTLPTFGVGQEAWFQSEIKEVTAGESYDLISYVVPDGMELRICSGIVSCKAPRTQKFKFVTTPAGDWVSPTSHIDPDNEWTDEEKAYDKAIDTYAFSSVSGSTWSSFLELLVNPMYINKVKLYAWNEAPATHKIDVDVYYLEDWHHIYEGTYADREWIEWDIPAGVQLITKARVRLYNGRPHDIGRDLNEFQFNTSGETPQETIYFDTYAIIPYLPEAPYPVPSGATFVLRVYNDDEDAQEFSANLAGFLQAKV